MILLGLTGGVGMGKSAAAAFFRDRHLPVIDTDLIARELVEPGQPALEEIRLAFGDHLIGSNGRLLRRELARMVFADTDARLRLESILHPRILQAWQTRIEEWRRADVAVGVVVIPLLFETGAASSFDAIVCVACSPNTQQARLRDRGWSDGEIQGRLAAQWPVSQKIQASDFVVWTDTNLETHAAQIDRILEFFPGVRPAAPSHS